MSRDRAAILLLFCALELQTICSKEHSVELNTKRQTIPSTCNEAMGAKGKNGVYLLQIKDSSVPTFYAYCLKDAKNGTAWMIIQRRSSTKINFSRDWPSYKRGFGDFYGDYWLGLDLIHAITYSQRHEIWFHMQDFADEERDAFYNHFIVGAEDSEYELRSVGKYSGNAGDSLSNNTGYKFESKKLCSVTNFCNNCAYELQTGGWWFRKCPDSNLNGVYHPMAASRDNGLQWYAWNGQTPLKAVHMAIRPTDNELQTSEDTIWR